MTASHRGAGKAMLGWVLLSRDAVTKAEEALKGGEEGVLDEIGFLALHQGFSDRFFPGTSVLHTRLRYALFVPWLISGSNGDIRHLERDEVVLTGQLKHGRQTAPTNSLGIIGGDVWPRPANQPASSVYWSAIVRWGLVHPESGLKTRAQVLRAIAATRSRQAERHRRVDGEDVGDVGQSPFVDGLPDPPPEWLKRESPLSFALTADEYKFLKKYLIGVTRSGKEGPRSLLANLAELPKARLRRVLDREMWSRRLQVYADGEDRRALVLARNAAQMAAVGRAVYAALTEAAKARDGVAVSRIHRDHLRETLRRCKEHALRLDLDHLRATLPALSGDLIDVLEQTMTWLRSGRSAPDDLASVYEQAEWNRKGSRSRLTNKQSGVLRRAEWDAAKHPLAEPLHYRWGKVQRLLGDLAA